MVEATLGLSSVQLATEHEVSAPPGEHAPHELASLHAPIVPSGSPSGAGHGTAGCGESQLGSEPDAGPDRTLRLPAGLANVDSCLDNYKSRPSVENIIYPQEYVSPINFKGILCLECEG